MLSSYAIDADEFCREYEKNEPYLMSRVSGFLDAMASYSWSDRYELYGVDNDFDLIEAMYEVYARSTGNLIRNPDFVEFRIQCAMNPEYTEKCLNSYAFRDVKDEILKRLSYVE